MVNIEFYNVLRIMWTLLTGDLYVNYWTRDAKAAYRTALSYHRSLHIDF